MSPNDKTIKSDHDGVTWKWLVGTVVISIITGVLGIYFEPNVIAFFNPKPNQEQVTLAELNFKPDLTKYNSQSFWLKYPDLIKMKDFGCNRNPTDQELQSLTRQMIPLWTPDIPYDRLHVICDWFYEPDSNRLLKEYDYGIGNGVKSYLVSCPKDCQDLYRHEFQQSLDIYKKIGFVGLN